MPQTIRKFLILILLLPQLAVAGLGSGFVLCISPGDHFKVEIVTSACCTSELGTTSTADLGAEVEEESDSESPDCRSCEDLVVRVDPTLPDWKNIDAPAPPSRLELPPSVFIRAPRTEFLNRFDRAHVRSHLKVLRSVVIRC